MEIERAHRTGKVKRRSDDNASSTRPRTVICRLVSWKQKDPILKAARIVKPDGMFVNEDLAVETLQRRKDQLPKLKQAKQAGKIAGSCLLWVMSTEISVDIAVDIAVDTRSIVGRQSVDIAVDSRSIVGRHSVETRPIVVPDVSRPI